MDDSSEEDHVFQEQQDSLSACAMLIDAVSTVVATSKILVEYDLSVEMEAFGKFLTNELAAIERRVSATALIRQQSLQLLERWRTPLLHCCRTWMLSKTSMNAKW